MREKKDLPHNVVLFLSSDFFIKLTVGWFLMQAIFFALFTKFGLPPDEIYHFEYINLFSKNNLSPILSAQEGYYFLGEAVRNPFFLYHYLLSIPYSLIQGWEYSYIILRFFNIALGVGSLYVTSLISSHLKVTKVVRNLTIFMFSNTLMFVFLSAAISYDNLFILLSLSAALLVLKLMQSFSARNILLFLVVILSGLLVKVTFIPIAFIAITALLFTQHKKLKVLHRVFLETFSARRSFNVALCFAIFILSILFFHRYALNFINYQSYQPACQQVLEIEQCRKNAIFTRNEAIYGHDSRPATQSFFEYLTNWSQLMLDRVYGVHAHKNLAPYWFTVAWTSFFLLGGGFALLKNWRDQKNQKLLFLTTLVLTYAAILFIENNSIYKVVGRSGFAIHGRYIFGVLPLLYLLWNHFILKSLKNTRFKIGFIGFTIIIFFISSLPSYLLKVGADWYNF